MDRRRRGKRKSASCIQRRLRFSFLRFMADPEKRIDSRKLKVKGKTKPEKRKDLTQRTQSAAAQRAQSTEVGSQRKDKTREKKRLNTENTECRGTKSTEHRS